jgi:hypothetical protein
MTFLELAEVTLEQNKKPMTANEIWTYAKSKKIDVQLKSSGITPWKTLNAQLGTFTLNNKSGKFARTATRPTKYFLRNQEPEIDKPSLLEKINPIIEDIGLSQSNEVEVFPESRQGTAKKAIKMLLELQQGYMEPNRKSRLNLVIAFAKRNKVIYGKAFDIIRIKTTKKINFENLDEVEKNLDDIIIYEVKSTNKKDLKHNFEKYFFGLSTAELLVAQNLKEYFRFIFVNTITKETMELSLKQVFEKAKGIYPVWSIQF